MECCQKHHILRLCKVTRIIWICLANWEEEEHQTPPSCTPTIFYALTSWPAPDGDFNNSDWSNVETVNRLALLGRRRKALNQNIA